MVAPARDFKVLSDLYAVRVIDTVNRGSAGIYSASEVVADLRIAQAEGTAMWADLEEHMRTSHDEDMELWDALDAAILVGDAAIVEAVDGIEHGGIAAIEQYDGELYDAIDPLTAAIDDALYHVGRGRRRRRRGPGGPRGPGQHDPGARPARRLRRPRRWWRRPGCGASVPPNSSRPARRPRLAAWARWSSPRTSA